jgi:hypothetical protein
MGRAFAKPIVGFLTRSAMGIATLHPSYELRAPRLLPERWSGLRQETANPFFEHSHQDRIHKFVVVGDVEANYPLPLQMRAKPTDQLVTMRLLHDKYYVGPIDLV